MSPELGRLKSWLCRPVHVLGREVRESCSLCSSLVGVFICLFVCFYICLRTAGLEAIRALRFGGWSDPHPVINVWL